MIRDYLGYLFCLLFGHRDTYAPDELLVYCPRCDRWLSDDKTLVDFANQS